MLKNTYQWLYTVALVTALASCVDSSEFEISGVQANPQLAIPLAFADLSVEDLVEEADSDLVKVYPDGLVYLAYADTLQTKDIQDLITPTNKQVTRSFSIPAGTIPAQAKDFRADSITTTLDLALSPAELSLLDFKSGNIQYTLSLSPANANFLYAVQMILPTVKNDATQQPVTITTSTSGSFDLAPTTATLNKNKFDIKLVLIYKKSNLPVNLANTNINVTLNFTGMNYKRIEGFFGDQSQNFPSETLSLGGFGTSLDDATISLAQPKIELIVKNEYKIPNRITFGTFEARKGNDKINVQLNPASPIDLAFPTTLGQTATTTITVTNAKALLDFNPDEFFYTATARVNAGLTTGSNAMTDTSKVTVIMNVEVPLYGRASNIILADTLKLDLGDVDSDKIEDASLKITSKNELPLSATLQLLLTDDNYNVIETLYSNPSTEVLKSSTVNAGGELVAAGENEVLINIPGAKLQKLFEASHIILRSVMNTSNSGSQDVKFKSGYTLEINAGLLVKLKIKA